MVINIILLNRDIFSQLLSCRAYEHIVLVHYREITEVSSYESECRQVIYYHISTPRFVYKLLRITISTLLFCHNHPKLWTNHYIIL